MVQVRLVKNRLGPGGELKSVIEVEFTVDGHTVKSVIGNANWVLGSQVFDPDQGRPLGFNDDPERWALLLPDAFTSGDLDADVKEMVTPMERVRTKVGRGR